MVWVIIILAVAAAVVFRFLEIKVKRRPSLEGIEGPAEIRAYDHVSQNRGFRFMRRIFVRELSNYNPVGTLADVGCGPGYLLGALAVKFPQLTLIGTDISPRIISRARASLGQYANLDFKIAGSHGLPFEDNSLDFAVSTLSLHHWSHPQEALGEFHRVLKPGGQFLIFDLRRNSPVLVHLMIRIITLLVVPRTLRKIKEPMGSILASYTPIEVAFILENTPFKEIEIKKGLFWMFVRGRKSVKRRKA